MNLLTLRQLKNKFSNLTVKLMKIRKQLVKLKSLNTVLTF